ncbi:MAG: SDR family NAD(P)-dependent oxidoreductase [Haloferacaceae archaeon]
MGRLTDKTALVTGASRGIGREIATQFAAEGATVGVNYPPGEEENARAVVEEIEDSGGEALALSADVSDGDAVEAMIGQFESQVRPLDVLVNNAGGTMETSPIVEMSEELWDRVVDVNLRGVFLTTKHAVPGMRDTGGGSIVNISSQYGIIGDENRSHYCAAKGGVISITRALARELGPEIRVNAIAPGPIVTGKRGELTEEYLAQRTETIPLGRLGQPEEVAPTATFLASEQSSYYTGQTLSPDGGEAMH